MLRLWLLPKYQTHTSLIFPFNIKKVKVQAKKGKSNDDLENVTFKSIFTALSSQISNLLFNFYPPNPLWWIFKSNAYHIYLTWKIITFKKKYFDVALLHVCVDMYYVSSSFISERRFADYIWPKKKSLKGKIGCPSTIILNPAKCSQTWFYQLLIRFFKIKKIKFKWKFSTRHFSGTGIKKMVFLTPHKRLMNSWILTHKIVLYYFVIQFFNSVSCLNWLKESSYCHLACMYHTIDLRTCAACY